MILAVMGCVLQGRASEVTPRWLLEQNRENRQRLKLFLTKGQLVIEVKDTANEKSSWTRITYEFRTDGERTDEIWERTFDLPSPQDPGTPMHTTKWRAVWDGKQYIHYYYPVGGNTHPRGVIETQPVMDVRRRFPSGGSPLDGLFPGDLKLIDEVLRDSTQISLRPDKVALNGRDCQVIDAQGPSGKYALWIDPARGFSIVKATVEKGNGDLFYGKPIGIDRISKQDRENVRFSGQMPAVEDRFSFSLDQVSLQQLGGIWLPTEADYQTTTAYNDGRVITENTHHKRTLTDPNPDLQRIGAFVPDIPNGTEISVDLTAVRYRWQDGKAVPDLDEYTVNRIIEEIDGLKQKRDLSLPSVVSSPAPIAAIPDNGRPSPPQAPGGPQNASERSAASRPAFSTWLALLIAGVMVAGGVGLLWVFRKRSRA